VTFSGAYRDRAMTIAFYMVLTFACMNDIIALKFTSR